MSDEIPVADATTRYDAEILENTEFPEDEYPQLIQTPEDLGAKSDG